MDIDLEYMVADPVMGTVSCASEAAAIDYANKVDGQPFVQVWCEGAVVDEYQLGRD